MKKAGRRIRNSNCLSLRVLEEAWWLCFQRIFSSEVTNVFNAMTYLWRQMLPSQTWLAWNSFNDPRPQPRPPLQLNLLQLTPPPTSRRPCVICTMPRRKAISALSAAILRRETFRASTDLDPPSALISCCAYQRSPRHVVACLFTAKLGSHRTSSFNTAAALAFVVSE